MRLRPSPLTSRRLILLAVVGLAGCARATRPVSVGAAEREVRAQQVAEGLRPVAQFLGDWEGSSESAQGTFTLARRVSWLVPDSWLLQQDRLLSADGREVSRSATLYTVEPRSGEILARVLGPSGTEVAARVRLLDDSGAWLILPQGAAEASTLFRTTLFNGSEWRAQVAVADASVTGGWREVERLFLRRRAP